MQIIPADRQRLAPVADQRLSSIIAHTFAHSLKQYFRSRKPSLKTIISRRMDSGPRPGIPIDRSGHGNHDTPCGVVLCCSVLFNKPWPPRKQVVTQRLVQPSLARAFGPSSKEESRCVFCSSDGELSWLGTLSIVSLLGTFACTGTCGGHKVCWQG